MLLNLIIHIKSKNIKSALLYLVVLYVILDKLNILKKLVNKYNHLTVFALLKSPHINKTAQQHFGYKFYNKIIQIIVIDFYKFVLYIKVLKSQLFADVRLYLTYNIIKKIKAVSISTICFKIGIFRCLNFLNFITVKILLKASNLMV